MTPPTFTRNCIKCGVAMELHGRRTRDHVEIVKCPYCGRTEEISNSGMSIPQSQSGKAVKDKA